MRVSLFVFLLLNAFLWPLRGSASPAEGVSCDLQIVASGTKISKLKIEVLRDPRSSSLILQYPTSDGIIRRLPAHTSDMAIGELHSSLDQVLREMQGPQCFARAQCRAFATKIRQVYGPTLQKIRTTGVSVTVYSATKGDSRTPTIFEVSNEAGAVVGRVGFVGWGQVGTCTP